MSDGDPGGLSRRTLVAGALAALATAGPAQAHRPQGRVPYGAAVQPGLLMRDASYRAAVQRWCTLIVPEGSLKWPVIRPTREQFRFEEADACLAFATDNGMVMRGHTLVWGEAMPDWTRSIQQAEAHGVLVDHIGAVVGRYAGRIPNWDVVNEPIAPDHRTGSNTAGLRPSIWLDRLGPRYIDIAFRAAAAADPGARLVLNEYDIEYPDPASVAKRAALLGLVNDLVDRGVPLHAVGVQGHLRGERAIDTHGLSAFVETIRHLGLDVLVTELDVIDDQLPGPAPERDRLVAASAEAFLSAIFAAGPPRAVLTWGITDRYSWVPTWYRRTDGALNRPLPLDADDRPKPLMDVIEKFCG